ncbi:MAG: hypothetical protein O3A10_15590 [Chloroflexi bacterium]|nr:hypothetical protein [Chloroflexota bacterium]MDA1147953.1 hypothetical protein [Chloroflexota bacterium]
MKLSRNLPLLVAAVVAALVAAMPVPAAADGHEDWELLVGSIPNERESTCQADVVVIASGFADSEEVAIGRIDDRAFIELRRVPTPANGLVRLERFDLFSADCVDGDTLTFVARGVVDGDFLGSLDAPFEVTAGYRTIDKPGKINLFPSSGADCVPGSITILGEGFPPNAGISIGVGAADAFAHELAEIDRTTSDSAGRFSSTPNFFGGRTCREPQQFAIHAFVVTDARGTPTDFPRASVIYTVGAPAPSAAGNADLEDPDSPRGPSFLLTFASLLLVTVARTITAGSRP